MERYVIELQGFMDKTGSRGGRMGPMSTPEYAASMTSLGLAIARALSFLTDHTRFMVWEP
jgi:hypothetical protein